MPNIVTHGVLTALVYHERASIDLILGSTVPDFVGMNRDYRQGSLKLADIQEPPDLREGIDFHLRTDSAFDSLPDRNRLLAEGREDCAANIPALPERTARTLANMGTDILLDVAVLETDLGRATYEKLKREVLAGRTALTLLDPSFANMVAHFFEQDRALNYENTQWLTHTINYRFSLRRSGNLAFDRALTLPVAEMLTRQLARIRSCAHLLIQQTAEALGQPNS